MRIASMMTVTGTLMCCLGAAGCATNPVTGQRQLSLVSEAQEIEMGRGEVVRTRASTGFVEDPALQSYVRAIGQRMADASERPDLPWEFHVIDDPMVNAFAAPGGFIFITRGILAHLNSEAELAGVVGHEVGHVTAKHSVSQISRATFTQGLLVAGSITAPKVANSPIGQLAQAGASIFLIKYGRDQETQADQLGHRYSLQQRYDVREMPKTFMTLQRVGEASGGGSRGPSFLSTHPDPGDRVAKTTAWGDTVTNTKGLIVDRDQFLTRIDGMMFGADPAEGYFEGARFLHPALRFQFDAPAGWQGANQKTQVILGEPNGQAQMQLTTATQGSPAAAMQAFAQQQGVQMGGSQNVSLGGANGIIAEFAVATAAGQQLRGQIPYVQHGAALFQFLGITPTTAWGAHGGAIARTLRSFRPTAANQQFQRARVIRIVSLSRATTTDALAQQSGGAITAQQLAIINGVEAGVMLPSGRRVKTVVFR